MKTIEEKAKECIDNLIDSLSLEVNYEESNYDAGQMHALSDYGKEIYKVGFSEGYNEAMRWRDPNTDPPKCNDLMQIKYGDIFSNIINYGHDRYLEDAGMWDIEQLANIKVLAWRPIN